MKKYRVKTNSGDILIGYLLEKDTVEKNFSLPIPFDLMNEGIWLLRDKHVTFLAKEEVKWIKRTHKND